MSTTDPVRLEREAAMLLDCIARDALDRFIDRIGPGVDRQPQTGSELPWDALSSASIQLSHAARLLALPRSTVEIWAQRGALERAEGPRSPRVRLSSALAALMNLELQRQRGVVGAQLVERALSALEAGELPLSERFLACLQRMRWGDLGSWPGGW